MATLYTEVAKNIGQVSIKNAKAEIERMNLQCPSIEWRMDFSEFIYVIDECDDEILNPCPLASGFCWIICD